MPPQHDAGRSIARTDDHEYTREEAVARVMADLIADMVKQATWRAKFRGGKINREVPTRK
jgi:hypothetical protein